jgi:glucan biosynthesis protein C
MTGEPPALPRQNGERFHALDALRAGMMLLGIVLHAAACYTAVPLPLSPYHDASTSPIFDVLCVFIHTFRLPAFFVMSGFFGALLLERRGPGGMLRNRWKRLMIPLIGGWFVLAPLVILAITFAWQRHPMFEKGGALLPASTAGAQVSERDGLLLHLWFLYDLFLFCLAAVAIRNFFHRFAPNLPRVVRSRFREALTGGAWLIVFPMLTAISLYPMHTGTFDTSAWLLPPVRILAGYGIFFSFGWLLYHERSCLPLFLRGAWLKMLLGFLLFVPEAAGCAIFARRTIMRGEPVHIMTILSGSFACWLFVTGLLGLCLRYFSSPRPWIRYLTDASYFLYLAHLPLVIFLQGILAPWALPAIVKFSMVVISATALLIVCYELRVRESRLSQWLNGRERFALGAQRER